jgi:putative hydrolase of the HAD superfamily
MPNLQAILIDLDDTLHDKSYNLAAFAQAQFATYVLANHGVEMSRWTSQYVDLNNLRIEKTEVFVRLQAAFKLNSSLAGTLREDFDANSGAATRPLPGLHALLQSCRARGMKIGIVTNGRDAFQRRKIAGLGIENVIDAVFTSGGFGVKKPDHRIFLACLAALGARPEAAVMVGDDFAADMEPALQLGMHTIWRSAVSSTRVNYWSDDLYAISAYLQDMA